MILSTKKVFYLQEDSSPSVRILRFQQTGDGLDLPMMEKIKMIEALGKNEQSAIFTMIDMAIANKKLKDNLTQLIAQ